MINQVEKKNPKRRFKECWGMGNWNVRTLGTVLMSMYNGQTPSRSKVEYWNGKINWLTSGELNCGIVNDTIEKITESGLDSANLKVIPEGILVIAITGLEASGTRGNCAILGCDTTLNQSCMALFPMRTIISSDFLFYWYLFIGDYYGIKYTQGTKQQSYNSKILNDLEIVIPSLDEQNKISSFFSKMDSMINLQQRKLDKLQATKKALLQEMFPEEGQDKPKRRFKGFTDAWEQRKLGDTNTFFTDGNYANDYPTANEMSDSVNGVPFLRGSNLNNGAINLVDVNYITKQKHNLLTSGHTKFDDIIIAVRGSLGNCGYVAKQFIDININSQLAIIRTDKNELSGLFLIEYLLSSLGKKEINRNITGTALKQLPINSLKMINIKYPSINEQEKISILLSKLNASITLHQRKLDKLKNLKQAYLNEMFV